jgi:hypothetical protein
MMFAAVSVHITLYTTKNSYRRVDRDESRDSRGAFHGDRSIETNTKGDQMKKGDRRTRDDEPRVPF